MNGFTGLKVWVNEGVQVKQYQFPWEEISEPHRRDGDKWDSVITASGVQFFRQNGTLVWFPSENITRVEATLVD